jgi:hypothetical protein
MHLQGSEPHPVKTPSEPNQQRDCVRRGRISTEEGRGEVENGNLPTCPAVADRR